MLAGRGVRGRDGGQEGEKDAAAKGRGRKEHVKGSGPRGCGGLRTEDTEGWAGSTAEMETGMLSQSFHAFSEWVHEAQSGGGGGRGRQKGLGGVWRAADGVRHPRGQPQRTADRGPQGPRWPDLFGFPKEGRNPYHE